MSTPDGAPLAHDSSQDLIDVHPAVVRVTHWINVVAMFIMVTSGWRIYNASPIFEFNIPGYLTLGGWLGGALLWHFAAMWVLVVNELVYVLYGIVSGHYRNDLLPITRKSILQEFANALRGKLAHIAGVYNALQRAAYLGVIVLGALLIASGLVILKPVQFQEIGLLMGGYEGARILHFFAMTALVLFVLIHVVMVALVPSTFLPMFTGRARKHH
jgi:thiosulfate reductase cytochrome b subunit